MENSAPINQCVTAEWTLFIALLTFLLGFIANKVSNKHTANRKEDRDLLDNITGLVDQLETKAFLYYSLAATNDEAKKTASEIRSLMSQTGRQVQIFSESLTNNKLNSEIVPLRQAITKELDNSERGPLQPSSSVFTDISKQCRILLGDLNMIFSKKYRQ